VATIRVRAPRRTRRFKNLWDQIEEGYTDQSARAKSQNQVKSISLIQREETAQQRR
jgi:hypothetical protein